MDAWHILSALCVCALGVLTFLKLVANELDALSSALRTFRRREKKRGSGCAIETVANSTVVESVVEKLA